MLRNSYVALVAASAAALALACTASTTPTPWTDDENGTEPTTSSSGGSSSGKTASSSSGGKSSSSSGGSSSGGSSSGGSSSGGKSSSSGGSTSSSGGSTSSSGGSTSSSGGSSSGGSTSSSGGTGGLCPANVALTAADLDAEIGWKSAKKTAGACSAADLTTLQNNFNSATIATYLDLGTGLSTSCKACAISYDTAANWGPIVATQADGGATGFVNFGACFGAVEGATCGKALQYEQFCYNVACNECTTTTTQRNACVSVAGNAGGMCEDFGTTTGTSCPNIATTATTCNTIIDAVKYLCQ